MLIIISSVLGVLLLTYLTSKWWGKDTEAKSDSTVVDAGCCGVHDICEDSTISSYSNEIIYYDDEELDAYSNTSAESYSCDEIEIFRDILYTMPGEDVRAWLKSLQLRNIALPLILKDEALMIISEL